MTDTPPTVADPSNADMLAAWDGGEGAYWVANAARFDATLAGYHPHLLAAAAAQPGEVAADVGCGNGRTTLDVAKASVTGPVTGFDLSRAMLDEARRRAAAEGVSNVSFVQGDAQVHPFAERSLDLVVSRLGVMFFGDPPVAFANIVRALRPGGRVAFLVWQAATENTWIGSVRASLALGRDLPAPPPGAPGPFTLGDPDHTRSLLTGAGLADVEIEGVREEMEFGATVDDAFDFLRGNGFATSVLAEYSDDDRRRALDALRSTIETYDTGKGVRIPSAAWVVTGRRP